LALAISLRFRLHTFLFQCSKVFVLLIRFALLPLRAASQRALKRLRKKFDTWHEAVRIRDVQSMARLSRHPNIVAMYEVHRTLQGDVWLVFEKMEASLHDVLLHYSGTLAPSILADWMRDALTGLQFLQASRYMHRDVKPENLLLSSDGTLKLADFTLARGLHEAAHDLTTYISTRWYRAPEILLGLPYGPAIDLFAAGCVLAEMFTRTPLFPASTELGLFHEIVSTLGSPPSMEAFLATYSIDAPPPLTDPPLENLRRKTGMPTDALQVLAGLLDVDPTRRWTTARALEHPFFHGNNAAAEAMARPHGGELSPALVTPLENASASNNAFQQSASTLSDPMSTGNTHSPFATSSTTTTSRVLANRTPATMNSQRSPAASSVVIRNPYKKFKSQRGCDE
jgi:serine/threonine protein kinase